MNAFEKTIKAQLLAYKAEIVRQRPLGGWTRFHWSGYR